MTSFCLPLFTSLFIHTHFSTPLLILHCIPSPPLPPLFLCPSQSLLKGCFCRQPLISKAVKNQPLHQPPHHHQSCQENVLFHIILHNKSSFMMKRELTMVYRKIEPFTRNKSSQFFSLPPPPPPHHHHHPPPPPPPASESSSAVPRKKSDKEN